MAERDDGVAEARTEGPSSSRAVAEPAGDTAVLLEARTRRPTAVLRLQRAAGNRATGRWLARDEAGTDGAAQATAAQTPFRAEIVKLIDSIPDAGLTEVPGQGIAGWFSAADMAYNRKVMGSGWTSCILFQGTVIERAKLAALKQDKTLKIYTNVQGNNADKNGPKQGAWHAGDSGYQPRKGDMYRLNFVDRPDTPDGFSHVGFIKEVKVLENGLEEWTTVDGGQRAGKGLPDKIAIKTRTFDRAKQLVLGGENADDDPRHLVGWLNPDELVTTAAKPAVARTVARARLLARDPLPGRDTADTRVALAAELAPLLDDDANAKGAVTRLEALAMADLALTVRLLVDGYGKKDRLEALAAPGGLLKAALTAVTDPSTAKGSTAGGAVSAEQQAQLRGFARRREWPTAIPAKGETRPPELEDAASELSAIVAAVANERASIADTMSANWNAPTLRKKPPKGTPKLTPADVQAMSLEEQKKQFVDNLRGGYMKSASTGKHDPTSYAARGKVAEADKPRLEAINKVIWEELGHEGSVSSINTYDNAVLTWGTGWAAPGRLPALMARLPQTVKDRLLDVGLAYQGGWLALDTDKREVLKGGDALQYARFNTRLLSAMYAMGFDKDVQGLVDAQSLVMFDEFDAMPKEIRDLDDRLIMVIVHCCWWGGMTMAKAKSLVDGLATKDALQAVVRWQASLGNTHTSVTADGATLVEGWQAALFNLMGRKLIAETFTERADAPTADHKGKTLIKPPGAKQYIVV
jgi:hypothetical protein